MAGYGDAETKKLRENVENQLGRLLQQLQVGSARAAARHVLSCVHAHRFILAPRGTTHARTNTHAHRLRNRITACGAEASNSRANVCVRAFSAALTLHGRQDCEELKEDLDEDEYESTKQAKILNVSSLVALHSKYTRTLTVEKF